MNNSLTQSNFAEQIKNVTTPLPGSEPKSVVYRMSVKQKHDSKSILDFYAEAIPAISRQTWINKIDNGKITINGKRITPETKVKTGDMTCHESEPQTEPDVNTDIKLIYVDNDIIVVNKPAPLPIHACGRFSRNTLISFLSMAFPNETFLPTHRIDANTTGLVVIARNKRAATYIGKQFQDHSVVKEYLVMAEGIIEADIFTSESSISKEITASGSRCINNEGHVAYTEFNVISRHEDKNQTLLKVQPHSGRTNQIRLHLANIKHPIVGDYGYKDAEYFNNNPLTYNEDCLFLHAWKITFKHPNTLQEITFTADAPKKFEEVKVKK